MFKTLAIVAALLSVLSVGTVGYSRYSGDPILGLAVLKPVQGGTGIGTAAPSDVGKVYKVSDDSPFTVTLQDDNTGAGGSFPWTPASWGNSTSTVLGNTLGFFANGSSTFNYLISQFSSSTYSSISGTASTSALIVSGLNSASCDVKSSSTGVLSCGTDATGGGGGSGNVATSSAETSGRVPFWTSTAGTPAQLSGGVAGFAWDDTLKRLTTSFSSTTALTATNIYGTLTGNADTATALAADPANCSSGSAPLGIIASGAVEGCFDVWTEAENTSAGYVVGTRALTVAGTANQITSSAGSQNLTADRTWTLSLPNHVIFPGSYVAGTGSTTNATSTTFFATTLQATSAFFTNVSIGADTLAEYISDTAGAMVTGNTESGISVTYEDADNTLDFVVDDVTPAMLQSADFGDFTCNGTNCSLDATYATFAYPYTPFTSWFSTSTISLNTAGIMSTASSTLHILRNTYASSSYLTADTATTTSFFGAMLRNCSSNNNLTWTNGTFGCEADDTGGGGSTDTVEWAEASTSPWVTSSLSALSSSTIAFLDSVRSTSTNHIMTNATTSVLSASSHIRSQGTLRVDGLTSAIALTGTGGLFAEYTGAACTNQVIEDLDALGAPTCVSINNGYWSGTDLSVANGGTGLSTFGGTNTVLYTTAADALSSEAAFTYDPATNLLSVDNLAISATGFLVLPATADPTVNAAGELALDTTSGNIIFATSTAQELVLGGATTTLYALVIASTSPDFASGGVIPLPTHFLKQQAVGIICEVDGGTSQQIFLSDSGSTNDTNTITCSTTETQYTFTTNNIWTAYEPIQLEFATKSGSPDYIVIRVVGFRTSD